MRLVSAWPITVALVAAFFPAFFALSANSHAAEAADEAFSRLYFGLQPPTNRDAERAVELVEELISAGRFGEAAPLVEEQLSQPQDFVDSRGGSLRRRLIGSFSGANSVEVAALMKVLAGAYEAQLAEATTVEALHRVVVSYPPSVFGTEALERLARAESRRGAYRAAESAASAGWPLASEAGNRAAADRLALLAATNQRRLGRAIDPLIAQSFSTSSWERLQNATAAAASGLAATRAPSVWTGAGGGPQRQTVAPGRRPSAWRAWRTSLPQPSRGEGRVGNSDPVVPPGGCVLAIDGALLVETAEALIAYDADAGKQLWRVAKPSSKVARGQEPQSGPLGLAADERLLYAITPSSQEPTEATPSAGRNFLAPRRPLSAPNALAAYDIASAGRLAWRLDGGDPRGGVRGARFLGPPAAIDRRLYAIAEFDQTLCLLEVDADSGRVVWRQPLVRRQREAGASAGSVSVTPTVSRDLVYCPTGSGAVVAIDPLHRQIAWTHYLTVDPENSARPRRNGWRQFRSGNWADPRRGWRHVRVIENEGRIAVVSPATQAVEVIDATTGELIWSRRLEGSSHLMAHAEKLVVTASDKTVKLHLAETGDLAWQAELPAGSRIAGEGLLFDAFCLIPLASGDLASVSLFDEATSAAIRSFVTNPLDSPPELGNLIYHRGAVYSHSTNSLECFRQQAENETIREIEGSDLASRERTAIELLAGDRIGPNAEAVDRYVAGALARAYATAARLRAAAPAGDGTSVRQALADLEGSAASKAVIEPTAGWNVVAGVLARDLAGRLDDRPAIDRAADATDGYVESIHTPSERWSLNLLSAAVETRPAGAVTTRSSRQSRADRGVGAVWRSTVQGVGDRNAAVDLWVETQGSNSRLIAANGWGERLVTAAMPADPVRSGSDATRRVGGPSNLRHGDWAIVRVEGGFAVYHVGGLSDEPLAWTSIDRTDADWRGFPSRPDGSEAPYAVGNWGVVSLRGGDLVCRELATGKPLWSRSLAGLVEGPLSLVATGDELAAIGRGSEGVRLSAVSGELLDRPWGLPPAKTWRAQAANHLLIESRSTDGRALELLDLADPSRVLWSTEIAGSTHAATNEHGLLVLLTDAMRLRVIDLHAGRQLFDTELQSATGEPIRTVRIHRHAGTLLLEVDRSNPLIDRGAGVGPIGESPLLTGELFCLDASTGASLWSGAARVSALSLLDSPVRDGPLLLLGRRLAPDSEDERAEASLSLVALDAQSGATVYRNDALPAGAEEQGPARLEVRYEAGDRERLLMRLGRAWVTLTPTDRPAPPRPPMIAAIEDPYENRPRDVKEIGRGFDRFIKSLFDDD